MANKILVTEQDGTPKQISFANHAGDFSPAAATAIEVGTPTDCEIALTGVTNTSGRQSAKVDLGVDRAQRYAVRASLEFAATPTAGNTCEIYWAPSGSATAANGNAANVTGSDGAYAGYSSNLAASVKQLQLAGVFICTAQATATVQVAECGVFEPRERYGSLVFVNNSGASIHSDDVECNIVFDPIIDEIQ